jgi:hypothetical protein
MRRALVSKRLDLAIAPRITSSGELLNLVIDDPWFAWLHARMRKVLANVG